MTAPSADHAPTAVPVSTRRDGDILVVTIDHPPVNALAQPVRAGLLAAVTLLEIDASLRGMVLMSTGRVFIGGADIREFAGPRLEPLLTTVCARLEQCAKPIVAAVHGAALGGGFEVALAAHARVAAPDAVVAFPEVLLGLLPGAGGTQRAPRLCGAALAIELMLTGRRLSAAEAYDAGLIDAVHEDVGDAALALARALAGSASQPGYTLPRARHGTALRDSDATVTAVAAARAALPTTHAGLYSPMRIVDCVEFAATHAFDEGAAYESQAFLDCLASPQRAALVHLFFAEREAKLSEQEGIDMAALGATLRAAHHAGGDEAMRAAAHTLLASGEAKRAADVDVASVRFAGVARWRGGVLWDEQHRNVTAEG
jgi:3-hydroxyacyl-CoA dehydrogenase